MYKFFLKKFSFLKLLILPLFLVLSLISQIHAQSADTLQFSVNLDKASISPTDSFTLLYTVTNSAPDYTVYNATVTFPFIDKLSNTTFTGSSTGLSMQALRDNGYTIPQLYSKKSINFSLYFKTNSTIDTGKKILNTIDNSNNIKSSVSFSYSNSSSTLSPSPSFTPTTTSSNSPTFNKDVNLVLPDVIAPKPEVSTITYPQGISGYDLTKIDSTNVKQVSGFFLQGVNKITFNEPIDLSSPEAISILKNIKNTFDLNAQNSINIQKNNIFNKKASVELNNTTFTDTPSIYFNEDKSPIIPYFDKTTKQVKFDIPVIGKYSAIGQINLTIPSTIQGTNLNVSGVSTDPQAKVIAIYDGTNTSTSKENLLINIDNGNFVINHIYPSIGIKSLELDVYARNGVISIITYPFTLTDIPISITITSTSVPGVQKVDYIKILIYILLGILLLDIIITLTIVFLTLKAKKDAQKAQEFEKKLRFSNLKADIHTDKSPNEIPDNENPEILNINKKLEEDSNLLIEKDNNPETEIIVGSKLKSEDSSSENRHEIIKAKVEKNLKDTKFEDE